MKNQTKTNPDQTRQIIDKLVAARKDQGLRQIDVANTMGVGQPSISELERGETNPRLSTLIKYAEAIGVQLNISFQLDNDNDKD